MADIAVFNNASEGLSSMVLFLAFFRTVDTIAKDDIQRFIFHLGTEREKMSIGSRNGRLKG
jgi:hypothetical protein